MRNLIIIALLLVGAFMAGWFNVNRDGDRTTIEINRNEIRSDTRDAIEKGRELLSEHENSTSWIDSVPPVQAGTQMGSDPFAQQGRGAVVQTGYLYNDAQMQSAQPTPGGGSIQYPQGYQPVQQAQPATR